MNATDLEYRGVLFPGVPGDARVIQFRAVGPSPAAGAQLLISINNRFAAPPTPRIWAANIDGPRAWIPDGEELRAQILGCEAGVSAVGGTATFPLTRFFTYHADIIQLDAAQTIIAGALIRRFTDTMFPGRLSAGGEIDCKAFADQSPEPVLVVPPNPQDVRFGPNEAIRAVITHQAGGGIAANDALCTFSLALALWLRPKE